MIEIKELKYSQNGTQIINGLSLNVEGRGIFGILGENSAEKTAIANLICGCYDADGGCVLVNEKEINRKNYDLKKRVRLVPTQLLAEPTSTPVEYLDFFGEALGVDSEKRYRQIKEALDLMGIEDIQNRRISTLGAAERCRISLAAALIGNPEYIILDEPFGGIDLTTLKEIYELLVMLGEIKTLVLLSHKPSEIKSLCKDVAIINGGKAVLSGNVAQIEARINSTHEFHLTVRGNSQSVIDAINSVEGVVSIKITSSDKNDVNSILVEHSPDEKMKDKLFTALSEINAPMLSFKKVTLTLEDVYYSLTSKGGDCK